VRLTSRRVLRPSSSRRFWPICIIATGGYTFFREGQEFTNGSYDRVIFERRSSCRARSI
jgi:hypothetical protein